MILIDPPCGWRFGFPKYVDKIPEDLNDWLIKNGYPQEMIDKLGENFYCRFIGCSKEDLINSEEDKKIFFDNIKNPPEPNSKLKKALSMSEGFRKEIIEIDKAGNINLNVNNLVKHKKNNY